MCCKSTVTDFKAVYEMVKQRFVTGKDGLDMLSKQNIIEGLKNIGIQTGMELEVHSSLSSFGRVDGGAEAVISALKECCGTEGSIFMPSLRLSLPKELTQEDKQLGIVTKIEILPENYERSAMGIIADTFRKQSDTQTGTGVFRISGWGYNADRAVIGGLDYIIHNGGKALLLGVDIYKLTAMHYVESNLPKEISDIFAPSDEINKIYPPDKWIIETGEPPVKAWHTIQRIAYEKGLIRDGLIGNCKVMFFDIWNVVELYENELKRNPYKLYGIER